ncbi:MAG: CPBP family intramembrane metalloprotease [Verrucomicrobiota bacterium]|nr:CPBP family intramembrane metalloprotease [Verrucomicrobiota bacterium]
MDSGSHSRFSWVQVSGLLLLCGLSLGIITFVNGASYRCAQRAAPNLAWLAETCSTSLIVCAALYLAIRPSRPFAMPRRRTNWSRIVRISAVWLLLWYAGSCAIAWRRGEWTAYAHGGAAIVAFLVCGPLQEELLFRGAIFELTQRVFRSALLPVMVSSVFFSLHHFELHHYRAIPAALAQVAFTFPMGVVFGLLRSESDSVWPGLLLHIVTNVPGCFGR